MESKTEKQFIAAFDKYSNAIYRFCFFRLSNNRELAKDMMQQTYLKAWEYVYHGNQIDNIRAFLYQTARNLIIDYQRARKNKLETSIDAADQNILTRHFSHYHLMDKIDAKLAAEILNELDDIYKEALQLRFIDGLRPKEIAQLLELSVDVVSVRINRGLNQMRNIINKKNGQNI